MTAVEQLMEDLNNLILGDLKLTTKEIWNKALETEKEQLKKLMWDETHLDEKLINKGLIVDNRFDKYWNETFNK